MVTAFKNCLAIAEFILNIALDPWSATFLTLEPPVADPRDGSAARDASRVA